MNRRGGRGEQALQSHSPWGRRPRNSRLTGPAAGVMSAVSTNNRVLNSTRGSGRHAVAAAGAAGSYIPPKTEGERGRSFTAEIAEMRRDRGHPSLVFIRVHLFSIRGQNRFGFSKRIRHRFTGAAQPQPALPIFPICRHAKKSNYENGVLKPAQPLPFREHEKVRITVISDHKPCSAIGRLDRAGPVGDYHARRQQSGPSTDGDSRKKTSICRFCRRKGAG